MTKFQIVTGGVYPRELDIAGALDLATTPYRAQGTIEQLQERIELQNKVLTNMLKVMFGQYQEDFSDPSYAPKTDAAKLEFILAGGQGTIWVHEV
jgi:hypothetical protein